VLFVAMILTIFAFFWVGSGTTLFERRAEYVVDCPSTAGLKKGSRVHINGIPVGFVKQIDFVEDLRVNKVRVTLSVADNVSKRIRRDSRVALQTDGLLGDVSVHISMGTADQDVLTAGDLIEFHEASLLDSVVGEEITGNATDLMRELVLVLRTIKKGEGSIGKLLTEPVLYDNLATFSKSLDQLAVSLTSISKDMETIIGEVQQERGALGKLIFSKEYEQNIGRAIEGTSKLVATLERVVANTEKSESIAMKLLTDEEFGRSLERLVTRLEKSAGSIETILGMVERGDGSLGRLVHDPSIVQSLQDVFLGVQELGYVQNLVRNAERIGREASSGEERASRLAQIEAARARFLATVPRFAEGKPVPASAKDSEGEKNPDGDDDGEDDQ